MSILNEAQQKLTDLLTLAAKPDVTEVEVEKEILKFHEFAEQIPWSLKGYLCRINYQSAANQILETVRLLVHTRSKFANL